MKKTSKGAVVQCKTGEISPILLAQKLLFPYERTNERTNEPLPDISAGHPSTDAFLEKFVTVTPLAIHRKSSPFFVFLL